MAIVKTPDRVYRLGELPPPLGQKVVSWPWGGTPHLTKWSVDALKYPLGTLIIDTIDGHPVIAQIQTHDTYGAHPEWGVKLHKGTSVFVPVSAEGTAMRDPPEGWAVSPMAGWHQPDRNPFVNAVRLIEHRHEYLSEEAPQTAQPQTIVVPGDPMDHRDWRWRERFTKIPKLGVLAGTTIAGFFMGGPIGAVVGLGAGLVVDREVRGGDWLDVHGDFGIGTVIPSLYKKTFQLTDSASGAQTLVKGKDMQEASKRALSQFYGSASTVVQVPGTNTFQTDKGDTFRLDVAS